MKRLNKYIDHTILKAEATETDIKKLCKEAREYDFFSVCINSSYVSLATSELKNSDVKVVAVVGFPLGAMSTGAKAYETDYACEAGADEIDIVIHVGAMKDKRYEYVRDDIAACVAIANEYDAIVKVIIETYLLTNEEIEKACEIAMEAGADFVKTSTGFSKEGATEHDVKLMRKIVGSNMRIKAAGGIRDYDTAMKLIDAGADRIGASSSVEIMQNTK